MTTPSKADGGRSWSPIQRAAASARAKARNADPDFRERHRAQSIAGMNRPEAKAKLDCVIDAMRSAEGRAAASVRARASHADPAQRAHHAEKCKEAMARPDMRAKISQATREGMARRKAENQRRRVVIGAEKDALRKAWLCASADARAEFLSELFAPIVAAHPCAEGVAP